MECTCSAKKFGSRFHVSTCQKNTNKIRSVLTQMRTEAEKFPNTNYIYIASSDELAKNTFERMMEMLGNEYMIASESFGLYMVALKNSSNIVFKGPLGHGVELTFKGVAIDKNMPNLEVVGEWVKKVDPITTEPVEDSV